MAVRSHLIALILLTTATAIAKARGASCGDVFPSASSRDYGQIIAETPKNAMGEAFQKRFGKFLNEHRVLYDNFEILARELFLQRLSLARLHHSNFATSVETETPQGRIKMWERRWSGESDGLSWSFGIMNHARADSIWKLLRERLDLNDSELEEIDTARLPENRFHGPAKVTGRVWNFKEHLIDSDVIFHIYQPDETSYFIAHAPDHDVPEIRRKLTELWHRVLKRESPADQKIDALTEFEWLWFWGNPFGRSGALIGDALSLLLQEELAAQGVPVHIREGYYTLDLEALSAPLTKYQRERRAKLLH